MCQYAAVLQHMWKRLEKAGKTIMALVEKSGSMDVLLYELSTATSLCVSMQQCMEHLAASSVNADITGRGKHVYDLRLRFVACQYKETHPLRRQLY